MKLAVVLGDLRHVRGLVISEQLFVDMLQRLAKIIRVRNKKTSRADRQIPQCLLGVGLDAAHSRVENPHLLRRYRRSLNGLLPLAGIGRGTQHRRA